jgi:DNA invertase Pin-like site-specific DNA recombinase
MAEGKFVSYLRVSTARQGKSGLGLEAQRRAVADFLNGGNWSLASEHVEVESGKKSDRPELAKALQACRLYGAKLVIAKLDRLSRNVHFLTGLQEAGVDFVAADMPDANRLTIHILAAVAQHEREAISARTKVALAAAKRRGTKLGGYRGAKITPAIRRAAKAAVADRTAARAADLAPIIHDVRLAGVDSLGGMARALTERGVPTARGGSQWSPVQVSRVLNRMLPR